MAVEGLGLEREGPDPRRDVPAGVVPQKLYRVGEIIEHTGISRQTLHTYALLGLILEERATRAGHRLYAETIFSRLHRIQEMKKDHKTLREIRLVLDEEAKRESRL